MSDGHYPWVAKRKDAYPPIRAVSGAMGQLSWQMKTTLKAKRQVGTSFLIGTARSPSNILLGLKSPCINGLQGYRDKPTRPDRETAVL
jgi:hypothetical protein